MNNKKELKWKASFVILTLKLKPFKINKKSFKLKLMP